MSVHFVPTECIPLTLDPDVNGISLADESYLERELVGFISKRTKRTGEPTNMPSLGEFCIRSLGFSMKGLLTRFLSLRPHLFTLPDDGRQHVLLAPGAVQAVGLSDGDSEGLPALPDDILGMSTTPRAPSSTAFDPDYHKWDQITQKIYDFLRSRGGIAQFRDVEAHMRERWPQLLSSQGYSPSVWKAPVFTYKRRNIFRKDGHMVAIIQRGGNNAAPATASHDGWDVPSAVAPSEDPFPPLSAGGAGGATGALPRSQAQSFARAQGVAPPLMDLAAERKALEALRDDIVARLDALQPLAELQEQNSSLRAACITLGRELLTVKEDMAAMKAQLQASGMLPAARPGVDVAPTISLGTGFGNLHLGDSARGYNVFHPSQGDIFLIGGHDGVTWLDTIDRFSTPSGSLASLAAMPAPRSFCSAVATPEGVIVVGGGNGELWYESAVCLQPGSTGWKALGGLKVARGNLATAATGGRVYAFGGGKPGEQYNLVEW